MKFFNVKRKKIETCEPEIKGIPKQCILLNTYTFIFFILTHSKTHKNIYELLQGIFF